ncbi:MAG: hypothetical protein A2Y79_00305 [Deltaproteobacteria bacterium RBG_13_43_22]|nr:MAG: hypothetical protein A2Y79_00305 [Deltaproteobacteria bacterium RBG_13_43_22]
MRLIHWSYFLALEEDFLRLGRFVEFNSKNFATFSLEMAHLLLAASSETDVVLKMLCKLFAPDAQNEANYRATIPQNISDFTKLKVDMPRYELSFQPWQPWDSNQTPDWWTAYNKVKHERDSYYEKANLGNVLQSMAALFVSNLYLYKDLANKGELSPWPQLFYPEDQYSTGVTPGEGGWALVCKL